MLHPTATGDGPPVETVEVAAYEIPTDTDHESDGTLVWDSTTVVVVHVSAGGETGLGYTYEHQAAGTLVDTELAEVVRGASALQISSRWLDMYRAVRNIGRPGLASRAISAVDIALWDLKARLLDVPVVHLVDQAHDGVPIYGSGGFTNYTVGQLCDQLTDWVEQDIPRVKMKVGRHAQADPDRVAAARDAVGDDVALFVDANGAYTRKQALDRSQAFADRGVTWHEEPVSSDDLEGLRLLRDRGPAGMDVTAGEYGDHLQYFRDMLRFGAVDCLQADVTRCGGYTAFLDVAALCREHTIDLSAHCAPQVSAHVCTGVQHLRHLEYFHDHVRVDQRLFDGLLEPEDGMLRPDRSTVGHGLTLRESDAEPYRL